ncbi:MAG: glycosyltransferase family 2 protein [Hyphomicrobium aestuarii]|nr:glycosyltransferase family 2 protein [Hyphomicrobium aestuarii]
MDNLKSPVNSATGRAAGRSPALAVLEDLHNRLASELELRIAVLLPCYNEEAAIGQTVSAFRKSLPSATIYVYDNNSSDGTAEVARAAGAIVRHETFQGKGNVVRRMFADVDADVYVLADGDMTYDPTAAPALIERLTGEQLDMVIAARVETAAQNYRAGHRFGNRLFNGLTGFLFNSPFKDIFSGYRVFSRRFVKSFPASSRGFEIESELTVHALDLKLRCVEVGVPYGVRPENSFSKLKTYRDGFRILVMLLNMFRMVSPFRFFGTIAASLAVVALLLGIPVVVTWFNTGLVPRFPTAILAAAIAQVSVLMLICGVIIQAIAETRREMKRFRYLELPAPGRPKTSAFQQPAQTRDALGDAILRR